MNYSKHSETPAENSFEKYLEKEEEGEDCDICKDDNFKFQEDFDSFKRFSDLFE